MINHCTYQNGTILSCFWPNCSRSLSVRPSVNIFVKFLVEAISQHWKGLQLENLLKGNKSQDLLISMVALTLALSIFKVKLRQSGLTVFSGFLFYFSSFVITCISKDLYYFVIFACYNYRGVSGNVHHHQGYF